MRKENSRKLYEFPMSTELGTVFARLCHTTNCFAFHNGEVIETLSPVDCGDEVVVKRVTSVNVRVDNTYAHLLGVDDINQTFRDLLSKNVSKLGINLDYCYLRCGTDKELVSLTELLLFRLWKDETIHLLTKIDVTINFEGENVTIPCKLDDTLENVVYSQIGTRQGYCVYNNERMILEPSFTLNQLTSSASLYVIVKCALFSTNVTLNTIDLSKYVNMRALMRKFNIVEVWYDASRVNPAQIMSDFIYQSYHTERHLHLALVSNPSASLYFSVKSISAVAKKEPGKIMDNVEERFTVQLHWLTIAIYDNFENQSNNSNAIVNSAADNISELLSTEFIEDDCVLLDHKLSYTAILCQEFQRCFDRTVLCLHQPYVKHSHTGCRPDFYFVSSNLRPLLVSDFKMEKFDIAKVETFGYCMAIVNQIGCSKPFIAMPASKKIFSMYLCFSRIVPLSGKSQLLPIEICKVDPKDSLQMRGFINTLIFAIKNISNFTIESFQVQPQPELILTTPLNAHNCVYECNEMVYKLYDKWCLSDKEDLRVSLGVSYLEPRRQSLSKDGRFYIMLIYKYIKQKTKELRSFQDYLAIMKTMEKLHRCGYVHSDIHDSNLLFPGDGSEAMLIDFDLMGRVGEDYPDGYNDLRVRHPDAKCGKKERLFMTDML